MHPVSEATVEFIDQHTYPLFLQKGKHIVKPGEVCTCLYLLCKGAMRGYTTEGSKQITTWITAENSLVTSIRGFDNQKPSFEFIEAIEDCELVMVGHDDLQFLFHHFPEMNIVGRKVYQQYFRDAEDRAYISRLTSAASRYNYFVKTRGEFLNRVPLKYIASFLGMTIETLSRMRSRLLMEKSTG